MLLTLHQKEVLIELLEESTLYYGKLQLALVELTVLDLKDPANPVIKTVISETKERFEELGAYQRLLANELGKPDLKPIKQ